jgi:hypothetical protein
VSPRVALESPRVRTPESELVGPGLRAITDDVIADVSSIITDGRGFELRKANSRSRLITDLVITNLVITDTALSSPPESELHKSPRMQPTRKRTVRLLQ